MKLLALVPARGSSQRLPAKNLRRLAGMSLVEHAVRFAALCPEVVRTIVSTDDETIAEVAREAGGEVPFLRPPALARDDTPMWEVVRHAVDAVGGGVDSVLLLQPTSPARLPADVSGAVGLLSSRPDADGVVSVSEPAFNPVAECVVERDGRLEHLVPEGARLTRSQDAPRVLRMNGAFFLWRLEFVGREQESWLNGLLVGYETPESRAFDIDDEEELRRCEALVDAGLVSLPWLS